MGAPRPDPDQIFALTMRVRSLELEVERLRRNLTSPDPPPPPRRPRLESLDDMGEITQDQGEHVVYTKSEAEALKFAARAAVGSWSLAKKGIAGAITAGLIGLSGIVGAAIHASWGVARVAVVSAPPVVVATSDAGLAPAQAK